MSAKTTRRSKGDNAPSESYLAGRYVALKLRLNPDRAAELLELAEFRGMSRTKVIEELIAAAWARRALRLPGRGT